MSVILFSNFLGRNSALSASEAVDPDYPLANLVDEKRDTPAKGTVSTNQYVQFDISLSTPPCDFFILDRGHNPLEAIDQSGIRDQRGAVQPGGIRRRGDFQDFRGKGI